MADQEELLALPTIKRPNLSFDNCQGLYMFLLERCKNGKLPYGCIKEAAAKFSTSTKTVNRVWRQGQQSSRDGSVPANVSSCKKENVGCKAINLDLDTVKAVRLRQRTNVRSLACALDIPKSTLHDKIKAGILKSHSNAVVPD